MDKLIGLVVLATVLYWVWHDAAGSVNILQAAGDGNSQFLSSLRGGQ